jgi:hypothetical protein
MPRERTIPNADDILELAQLNAEVKKLTRKADGIKARLRAYADRQGEDLMLQAEGDGARYLVEVSTRYGLDDDKVRQEFGPEDYPDLYETKVNTGAVRMFFQVEGLSSEDYEKPQPNRYVTIKETKL